MLTGRIRADSALPWLVAILLIGGLVRIAPVLGGDFPAGDGGLFATMIEDIRRAGFALPAFTTYNGGDIPFAYPPLGLYLGALVPADPVAVLEWLPPMLAAGCIVPVYFATSPTAPTRTRLAAAGFYALAPFGWFWLVQGGGLTRALAMLLGLTALALARRGRPIPVGILGGLTALSHPETAIFAAVAVAAVYFFNRAWRSLVLAGVVSILVVLPWLAIVASRHGLEPFLAAAGARGVNPLVALLSISSGRPGMLDLAGAIGLVGLVASGVGWLYAASVGTVLVLTTSIATHFAPLAAIGVGATVGSRRVPAIVLGATAALLLVGAGLAIGNPEPLSADDRDAMGWIRSNTPAGAGIAVLSDEIWSRSDEAEWLPYLTDRESVTTMQGREWLPDWTSIDAERKQLQACDGRACVGDWLAEHEAAYVYLADGCCQQLANALGSPLARSGDARIYAAP